MHIPVLLAETLLFLEPEAGKTFLDGTVGHGGHAEALLERIAPTGRLLGIDRDPRNLAVAKKRLAAAGKRAVLVGGRYANLRSLAAANGFHAFDGILLDIGFSSAHVDDPTRGFSFLADGPLDMRYDPSEETKAAAIVNGWTKDELARLFRLYGEEPRAEPIAKLIVDARKRQRFTRTTHLAETIATAFPRRGNRHPATLVFQALRIAVNDELEELKQALPEAIRLLKPGGRLAVISFHSLEDRIIKQFFAKRDGWEILTKRPMTASDQERRKNPRARSAKLRVIEKKPYVPHANNVRACLESEDDPRLS